jgi:hypothetical protein
MKFERNLHEKSCREAGREFQISNFRFQIQENFRFRKISDSRRFQIQEDFRFKIGKATNNERQTTNIGQPATGRPDGREIGAP